MRMESFPSPRRTRYWCNLHRVQETRSPALTRFSSQLSSDTSLHMLAPPHALVASAASCLFHRRKTRYGNRLLELLMHLIEVISRRTRRNNFRQQYVGTRAIGNEFLNGTLDCL